MSPFDDGSSPEQPRRHSAFTVPAILSAVARRVSGDRGRRFVAGGREFTDTEWIEIDVETDAEFPVAGVGPALHVGTTVITDSERVADNRYRFFAPGGVELERGSRLALGRAGSGLSKPETPSKARLQWKK